ncbi:MAG: DUF2141 domain-containing protein [Gammaproteobacteria bacterium]
MQQSSLKYGIAFWFLPVGLTACATHPTPVTPVEGDYTLTLQIKGITAPEGVIRAALYNDKSRWLDVTQSVRGRLHIVQSHSETLSFYGLPEGEYAVAVFQDINANNKMDKRWLLVPSEPFGFSIPSTNTPARGRPNYEQAKFVLHGDTTIAIQLSTIFSNGRVEDDSPK